MPTVRTDEHAPRVFVSCLECYNAGRLIGDWYEASEAGDLTPTQVHHRPIRANTHEELWCLDFENIPVRCEMSPMDAAKWGELYDDLDDDVEWPALCAWVRSGDYVAEGNTDLPCLSDFRDRYWLIPIKGVVGPWPSDVGSLLAMCLVRMRDPSALARRCSSRPLIAFDDPFDVPRRAVTRPLRRLVGQAHRVAVLRRAPSAIPAGPVVAGAGFGNVRRGLRGRVRGASQSNSWAPSVA